MKKILFLCVLIFSAAFGYFLLNQKPVTEINPEVKQIKTKFAVLSDTHSDSDNTRKALLKAKENGARFIMNTGDLTKVGSSVELDDAQKDFQSAELDFYLAPGDHDIYSSGGSVNFEKIIGRPYYSTDKDFVHMVILDTSDTSLGINSTQLAWLKNDLEANKNKPVMIFMHLPVYHPSSPRTIWEKEGNNEVVKRQTQELLTLFKKYRILAVFAGDHHLSSDYTEPVSGVKMYVVGAVTGERNLQKPRFDIVTVYEDNSVKVEELVI